MHVEIDRETDDEQRDRAGRRPRAGAARRARGGRGLAEDAGASPLQLADEIADNAAARHLRARRSPRPASCCGGWPTTHFTFLGYRENALVADGGRATTGWSRVPGTGLGILRADQPQGGGAGRLPPEVSAHARETQLLVITKANSRSTVHRPAYLDYIGVKTFDDARRGRRRAPLPRPVHLGGLQREHPADPGAAAQGGRGARPAAASPANSHSGKDLLQILETYPRDELFQISVDDLEHDRRSACCTCRSAASCGCSCAATTTAASCPAWSTCRATATPRRSARRWRRSCSTPSTGTSVDYTALVSESVLARLHFVVRTDPGARVADVDPAEVEARLVAATRSWDDDFFDALQDSCSEEEAARLVATLRRRLPRGVQGGPPGHRGGRGPAPARGARRRRRHRPEPLRAAEAPAEGERRLKLYHVGEPVSLSVVLPRLQEMGVEVVDERPYEIDRPAGPRAWVYDFGLRYEPSGELPVEDARTLLPGRLRGGLGGRRRERRLQRAGPARRADLAAGDGAAGLRQVPAPGRLDVQPGLHRGVPGLQRAHRPAAGAAVRGALRPRPPGRRRGPRRRAARGDPRRARRGREPGPGPHPALAPGPGPGHPADQLLPGRAPTARPKPYVAFKLDPQQGARPARSPGRASRSGSTAPGSRACTCASARSPAAACAGRTGARTSAPRCSAWSRRRWSRTPSSCRSAPRAASWSSARRPDPTDREAVLAEGIACYRTFISGLLDVTDNLVAARRPPRGRAAAAGGAPRRRRPLPGGRGRQGHRDVLRHRQPGRARLRLLARRRLRLRRLGRLRPQGDGHHRARCVGVGQAPLPRARDRHPGPGLHRRRHRRHVRRRLRQRHAALRAHPAGGRLRPPARLPRPRPRRRGVLRRAAPALRPAALVVGRLRPVADLGRRRRLPAHRQVDPDQPAGARAARARRRRSPSCPRPSCSRRSSPRRSTCCGTAASAPTSRRRPSPTPTSATRPTTRSGSTAPSCGPRWSARAATSACTQLGRIEYSRTVPGAGGRINTDAIDNSAGVDTSDHEVNIKILLDDAVRDGALDPADRTAVLVRDDRRRRPARPRATTTSRT